MGTAVVLAAGSAIAAGKAEHVVVVVWDGMRPDYISEATTPVLAELARSGVTFLHHHPAWPSMTEVNGTTIATGVYPQQSGIVANVEYLPDLDKTRVVDTYSLDVMRKGDQLTGGHFIGAPTVAEILHRQQRWTAIAGSKPVALLHDRSERNEQALGATVFAGNILPGEWGGALSNMLGGFPDPHGDKTGQDAWTTDALTRFLWKDKLPAYSLLWMAEPDYSQHHYGPGSKQALAGIANDDKQLGRLVDALRARGAADSTDVIVVSDHGFSSVTKPIRLPDELKAAGFAVFSRFPSAGPKDGDILLVGNGGEVACYVAGHSPEVITRLVRYLQGQPYTGVIFAREKVGGAFPFSEVKMDCPNAPDVAFSMRWTSDHNKFGVPNMIYSYGGVMDTPYGQHGTLDPTDMHNTCVAFGPDFKRGMSNALPSGNIDIAPTVLWLLGVTPDQPMSGRVLTEALTIPGPEVSSSEPRQVVATAKNEKGTWRQYLNESVVNGVVYFDEGNGAEASP